MDVQDTIKLIEALEASVLITIVIAAAVVLYCLIKQPFSLGIIIITAATIVGYLNTGDNATLLCLILIPVMLLFRAIGYMGDAEEEEEELEYDEDEDLIPGSPRSHNPGSG